MNLINDNNEREKIIKEFKKKFLEIKVTSGNIIYNKYY